MLMIIAEIYFIWAKVSFLSILFCVYKATLGKIIVVHKVKIDFRCNEKRKISIKL